jgi:hypothetical protein
MPSIALNKPKAAMFAGGNADMCYTTGVVGAEYFRKTAWSQRSGISTGTGQCRLGTNEITTKTHRATRCEKWSPHRWQN